MIASKLGRKEIAAQISHKITSIWVKHAREHLTVDQVLSEGWIHILSGIDCKPKLLAVSQKLIHLIVDCALQLGRGPSRFALLLK